MHVFTLSNANMLTVLYVLQLGSTFEQHPAPRPGFFCFGLVFCSLLCFQEILLASLSPGCVLSLSGTPVA